MKSYRKFWLGLLVITAGIQMALIVLSMTLGGFLEFLANYEQSASEDPEAWRFLFYPFFSLISLVGLIGLVYFSVRGRARPAKIALLLSAGIVIQAFVVSNLLRVALGDDWDIGSIRIPFLSLAESWDLLFSEFGPYWTLINLDLSPVIYGILTLVTMILFPRSKTSGQSLAHCAGCNSENPIGSSFCTSCGQKMLGTPASLD